MPIKCSESERGSANLSQWMSDGVMFVRRSDGVMLWLGRRQNEDVVEW
jgi:hypothetical protein